MYAKTMAKWMKEWMDMINTVDDIIADNGMMTHNFQSKNGFHSTSDFSDYAWVYA